MTRIESTEGLHVPRESPLGWGHSTQSPEQADKTCRICGLPKAHWSMPTGYEKKGERYCCEGCAEGKGCTCVTNAEKQRLNEQNARELAERSAEKTD